MLKNWVVIIVLALIGLGLGIYWMTEGTMLGSPPDGVTPQGDTETTINAVAALAGAITTLGAAIFGVLGKLTEYRKAQLEIEEKRIELDEKRRNAETG